ncbi:MAG: acyl-CoA dehydrogenase family protein [Actinomycetota bacterium]
MDFDFTPEQYALRDMARDLFEKESSPARLRELWVGKPRDPAVWRTLAEVDLLGLTVSEEHGGAGGDEVDLALILEEAGRAALPEPLVETVAVGAPLLSEAGTEAQREEWLPRIARGEAVVAVQLRDAPFVVDADIADLLLLEGDGELHAVPSGGFRYRPVTAEDRSRRLFAVEAETSASTRMAGRSTAAAEAFARGATATAAVLNGIALRLLEMTVAYVKDRQQFGRPVGSFQAVKHKLATVYVLTESSRSATWSAAYALARSLPDRHTAAHVAKAHAADVAALAGAEALQCHGGIGFTWEHDLHLWLKRGKALESAFGTAAEHRAAIAGRLREDVPAHE